MPPCRKYSISLGVSSSTRAWKRRSLPSALRAMDEPNGLVAATRSLSPRRLLEAYRKGLFPWYSEGQPVLWWSPNPRMVAHPDRFAPRRSLRELGFTDFLCGLAISLVSPATQAHTAWN